MITGVEPPGVGTGRLPGAPSGGGLPGALAAEWTKLWSLRSTWWGLFGAGLLMGLVSLIMAEATVGNNKDPGPEGPPGVVSVSDIATGAVETVQFVVLALALLMVTGEYATGSIRATLQWVPPRGRMLLSKAAVAVAVVFPTAVLLTLIGSVVAWFRLDRWGNVDAGDLVHDALTIGLYLSLMSVLVMGVGAMLRSTAATLTTAFIFVLVLPVTLANTGVDLLKDVADGLPSSAGRYLMNGDGPYPVAAALAILAVWTVAAVWGGITVLRQRDA